MQVGYTRIYTDTHTQIHTHTQRSTHTYAHSKIHTHTNTHTHTNAHTQFYYLFGFLTLVFIILLITCAEITIVLCYFQLCSEGKYTHTATSNSALKASGAT